MSLIVAKKSGSQVSIIGDTKLTYENVGAKVSLDNPLEGVIKSLIVHDNLCISIAGELTDDIDHQLHSIKHETGIECEKVIQILTELNRTSGYKTDFIVVIGKPEPLIYLITKDNIGFVDTAWIGDQQAFNRFQESFIGVAGVKDNPDVEEDLSPFHNTQMTLIRNMKITLHDPMIDMFKKMSYAMDDVIADETVKSVGGFKVQIVFSDKFDFNLYQKHYANFMAAPAGQDIELGPKGAQEGGYSINFLGGAADYKSAAIHIRQGDIGIVYHGKHSGLLKPTIFHLDEVDFVDFIQKEFGIEARYPTVSKVGKRFEQGREALREKNFAKATAFFEEAITVANDSQKAELLFYNGAALHDQKEYKRALENFNMAVAIDPSYYARIDEMFQAAGLPLLIKVKR